MPNDSCWRITDEPIIALKAYGQRVVSTAFTMAFDFSGSLPVWEARYKKPHINVSTQIRSKLRMGTSKWGWTCSMYCENNSPLSRARTQARREEASWVAIMIVIAMTMLMETITIAIVRDRNPCSITTNGTHLRGVSVAVKRNGHWLMELTA